MDTYKILVEGYARPGNSDNKFFASPTSVLIISNGKKVLTDPGADKEKLLNGLKNEGLTPEDIDIVFLSHWHPDHFLNIKLFPNHDIVDSTTIWKDTGEEEFPNNGATMEKVPGTDIQILSTPGHNPEHASLLINVDGEGVVCISHDVFWWEDGKQPEIPTYEDLISNEDPYLADETELIESRKLVLEKADWIIPGHGKKFKNPLK